MHKSQGKKWYLLIKIYNYSQKPINLCKIYTEYAQITISVLSMKDDKGKTPADIAASFESVKTLAFLAETVPETFPIELFDQSKAHKALLKKVLTSIAHNIRKEYPGTKEFLQKYVEKINKINKIFDAKIKVYNQQLKAQKEAEKEAKKTKKSLNEKLKKFGNSKGE